MIGSVSNTIIQRPAPLRLSVPFDRSRTVRMTSYPFHSFLPHSEQVGNGRIIGASAEAALFRYPPNSARPPSRYGAAPRVRRHLLWSGHARLRAGERGCYAAVHCVPLSGPRERAIKDEVVELLRNEDTMWREVVRMAFEQHSVREPSPPPPVAEHPVQALHRDTEEIKRPLDGLWGKIEESVVSPTQSGNMQVDANVDRAIWTLRTLRRP